MKDNETLSLPVKILLSAWVVFFLLFNGVWYLRNTLTIFTTMKWGSFILLINPAFWIWIVLVSSCWYAPLTLTFLIWVKKYPFSKIKFLMILILLPLIVTIIFSLLGDFWFPLKFDGDSVYMRIIPFL